MIHLILLIAIVGFIVYAITAWLPMPQPFKQVIIAIAVVCLVLYALSVFGVYDLPLPKARR